MSKTTSYWAAVIDDEIDREEYDCLDSYDTDISELRPRYDISCPPAYIGMASIADWKEATEEVLEQAAAYASQGDNYVHATLETGWVGAIAYNPEEDNEDGTIGAWYYIEGGNVHDEILAVCQPPRPWSPEQEEEAA